MNNIQNIRSALRNIITGESKKKRKEIEDERVRLEEVDDIKLAKNPYLSLREYERLAISPYPFVRLTLAYWCNISKIIEILAADPDPVVRSAIPGNINIPKNIPKDISTVIFCRLAGDQSPIVTSRVTEFSEKFHQEGIFAPS